MRNRIEGELNILISMRDILNRCKKTTGTTTICKDHKASLFPKAYQASIASTVNCKLNDDFSVITS